MAHWIGNCLCYRLDGPNLLADRGCAETYNGPVRAHRAFSSARGFLIEKRSDYTAAYEGFRWPEVDDFNWALDWFDSYAEENDSPALVYCNDGGIELKLTFRNLRDRSNQVANFLSDSGMKRGDRVLLMLPNVVALWEVMLASMKLGLVVIPATTLLSSKDLEDRLHRGRVRGAVVESGETGKVPKDSNLRRISVGKPVQGWTDLRKAYECSRDFPPRPTARGDDPLLLYFTSGTTSRPKPVVHTHKSYPVGHLSTMYWIGLLPGDIHLNVSSAGWAKHAWSSLFAPWNAGATVLVYQYDRFHAPNLLEVLVRYGVTTMCAPPTVWRMLIQERLRDYPVRLRELASAGEPLNPNIIEAVESAWGVAPRDGFGQSETTAVIGNSPGQPIKKGSMGRPMPGYQVKLLDADGTEGPEGQIALSLAAGPVGLMKGYLVDEGLAPLDADIPGSYLTGDIASCDEDGYFTYVGRADDVFKSSDYRISPFELESAVNGHWAVSESAVVPSPHPTRLCVPKAYISLIPGQEPSAELAFEILRYLRGRLSPFMRVRRVEFVELPKTISGKIRRVELRHREDAGPSIQRGKTEFWEEDFHELGGKDE